MISINEKKIKIGANLLNFVFSKLKDSKPEKTLFLVPGGLETAHSAFKPQLENLPKLLPNYQIISYDPPGLGKSRPPTRREFPDDVIDKDGKNILEFLDKEKIDKLNLLGWSFGGAVSFSLASKYPSRVEKLVLLTSGGLITDSTLKRFELSRDVTMWPEKMLKPFAEQYGIENIKEMWSEAVDFTRRCKENYKAENLKNILSKIESKTLIFHGENDLMMDFEGSKFLHENIRDSRLIVYEGAKGDHTLHLKNHQRFNQDVADFLSEN